VPQFGGWTAILERVQAILPEGLKPFPPTQAIPLMTVIVLVIQGLFFASSARLIIARLKCYAKREDILR
jgi:hypothetical protein